jgi:hypothetical protein
MKRSWLALIVLIPLGVDAQDVRLDAVLDGATRVSVQAVIDSAQQRGLPTEPLVQKALEGARKSAESTSIARAVAALSHRLELARTGLGAQATESELVAGASALYVGIPVSGIARLRTARPQGSLTTALVALTFFVQRGVTRDASLHMIESLVAASIDDTDLLRLQQSVDTDIRAGAAPASASEARVEALLLTRTGRVR